MKALVGMLVAVSLMGGSAYAAPAKKSAKAKTAKAKASKQLVAQNTKLPEANKPAAVQPASAPTAPSEVAPAATANTASIKAATAEAAPKRWSFMYDTWSESNVADSNNGRGEFEAAETIRIAYKLTPVLSVSLTNTIIHSWGTTSDNRRIFTIDDPYIMFAHSKVLGQLPSPLKSKAYLRLYPGTSESSRNKGQVGFARGMFNFGIEPNKVISLSYEIQPRYYFQTYKTYQKPEVYDQDGNRLKGSSEGVNTMARVKQYANLGLNISSKLSMYQNLGMDYEWYHSDPEANNPANRSVDHKEFLYAETGIGYAMNDNLSFAAGVYSEKARNLLDQKDDFSIYRDNESLYFLEGTVTF